MFPSLLNVVGTALILCVSIAEEAGGAAGAGGVQPLADAPPSVPGSNTPAPVKDSPSLLAGPGAGVTRADLAAIYLRFEHALAKNPPLPGRVKNINAAFDEATMAFFGGGYGSAIAKLTEVIGRLENSGGDDTRSVSRRFAESLKVRIEPSILVPGSESNGGPVTITVSPMHMLRPQDVDKLPPEAAATRIVAKASLRLDGAPLANGPSATIALDPANKNAVEPTTASNPEWSKLPPGRYEVVVEVPGEAPIIAGAWTVMATAPSVLSANIVRQLSPLRTSDDAQSDAINACLSRARLLVDNPSNLRSAEFLVSPIALAAQVKAEAQALADHGDPYRLRSGDWWVGVPGIGRDVPCRFYAPAAACKGDAPVPLVVCLHGAGGDESMFMDGYGAGEIKRLADAHGFIVVSPSTNVVQNGPGHLDAVLGAAKRWYSIDPDRIYILGHSMGANATATLAALRCDTFAAALCMAGGAGRAMEGRVPPMLVIAGEFDPIFLPGRIKSAVTKAQENGAKIELRIAKDYGHTMLVGAKLEEGVDWLLSHTRALAPAPEKTGPAMMDGE